MGAGCPPPLRRAALRRSRCNGRLARAYGYGSLAGPALFAGAIEQAQGMLDLAIAVCRDPDPGEAGEALDAIGAGFVAARALLDVEGGVRGALDLLFRSVVRAATERLPSAASGSTDGAVSLSGAQISRG